jgi:hypothetical protein
MMLGNTNGDSKFIMHLIKENTIGAEIGVWKGSSSREFIKKNLKKFYMVDPWSVSGYEEPISNKDETFSLENFYNKYSKIVGSKSEKDFNSHYESIYKKIIKEFSHLPEVEIVRKNSTDFFNSFEGEKLDWIYIDGDHSYTGVINCLKVMKPNGIILGDDYKWNNDSDKGGVKKAVNEFSNKYNFKVHKHGNVQFRIQL